MSEHLPKVKYAMKTKRWAYRTPHVKRKTVCHALVGKCNSVLFFKHFAITNADRGVSPHYLDAAVCAGGAVAL